MKFMRVSSKVYGQIMDHLDKDKKIAAIKALRRDTNCGLKEAKEAIERVQHETFQQNYPDAKKRAPQLVCGPIIKKLILDFGEGDIELDLEGMQLTALMELQTIGLDACADILELVDVLKAFSEGRKMGVPNA